MYIANIMLSVFFFFFDYVCGIVSWPSALWRLLKLKIMISDFSFQDQWLVRLLCGEKIVTIYQMVVLEIDVKLRFVFLFAFSINRNIMSDNKSNLLPVDALTVHNHGYTVYVHIKAFWTPLIFINYCFEIFWPILSVAYLFFRSF